MNGEVRSVSRLFLGDVQRLGFLFLRVGTGVLLEAARSTDSFVEDTVDVLEQRKAQLECVVSPRWESQVIKWIWGRTIRAVRFIKPGTKSWRGLATRIDRILLEKCHSAVHKSIAHPE
jgi:hypothetical protein